jgi:CDP-paratose 2-epimerase
VLDYARSYGLPAVVFRMSCIYGPHQHGNEDQGWVAHFLIARRDNEAVTIFGDGLQVRDVLFVEDLVDAFQQAMQDIGRLSGHAFNIGGGPTNTLSLTELVTYLQEHGESAPIVTYAPTRTGDQRYYVSDTTRFCSATGWHPRITVSQGLERLSAWLMKPAMAERPLSATVPEGEPAARRAMGAAR